MHYFLNTPPLSVLPQFFDIHSHLNFADFDPDRDEVIDNLKSQNIYTITVGTDLGTSHQAVDLADGYQELYATIGLHPGDNAKERFIPEEFASLVEHPKVVAIGECGLDYGRLSNITPEEKVRQKEDFERQVEFAVQYDKPLMIHCRNAYDDLLSILESKKKEYGDRLRGNMHFFTAGTDVADRCLSIGFTLSFTGVITFVEEYADLVSYPPLEMIMAETDAPFVAPVPWRGQRNEPQHVREVVHRIAQVRKEEYEVVRVALVENAVRVFSISIV